MLPGRCDGFGLGRLGGACTELTGWFKELVAQVLQLADGRRCLGDAAPTAAGPIEHGPDQRQAGGLAGELADDLDAPAGFPEGAFDWSAGCVSSARAGSASARWSSTRSSHESQVVRRGNRRLHHRTAASSDPCQGRRKTPGISTQFRANTLFPLIFRDYSMRIDGSARHLERT
jgi:hypothetical protein